METGSGLVNSQGKYLTAETFGFKINASGNSLRKKMMWILEHDQDEEDIVYIRSHLGRYLGADKKGNVSCSAESKGPTEKFRLSYHPSGDGRWAFQNTSNTYHFGGSDDTLMCEKKAPTDSEWWTARLAVHPQVNMRNAKRKRYAHLQEDEIHFNEITPWGQDALITVQFHDGKYCVRTCDNRYLSSNGTLADRVSPDTLYTLEIKSGNNSGMVLKDCAGKYMTCVGTMGKMQSRDKSAKQDIVFTLEDSHPQAFITAHNGKKVSTKQGVDIFANQDELSDKETFQFEYDRPSDKWRVRTAEDKYWSLEAASGIQAVGSAGVKTGLFDLETNDQGQVAIKACNGKYVTAKLNGSLYATSDKPDAKELFYMTLINRPILILRCEFGFTGFKTPNNPRVECNKSTSTDLIYLEHTTGKSAEYYLKGGNGKYWSVQSDGMINSDSDAPEGFIFQLIGQSKMVIRSAKSDCMYIKGEQNGIFCANVDITKATHWEY
jgi:hypothetical protein